MTLYALLCAVIGVGFANLKMSIRAQRLEADIVLGAEIAKMREGYKRWTDGLAKWGGYQKPSYPISF